jgi:hypothetical protein
MSPLGITFLMLVAFAGFFLLAARKLALVAALQPEVRWDHPGARLRTVLLDGLLQQRMIRRERKPGIMHTALFLGFLSLLLRKLQLIVIGYDETFTIPGAAGGAFALFKDLAEVAVVVAVAYAFYRRLVLRPARLEPNREGLLVLTLISLITHDAGQSDWPVCSWRCTSRPGSPAWRSRPWPPRWSWSPRRRCSPPSGPHGCSASGPGRGPGSR